MLQFTVIPSQFRGVNQPQTLGEANLILQVEILSLLENSDNKHFSKNTSDPTEVEGDNNSECKHTYFWCVFCIQVIVSPQVTSKNPLPHPPRRKYLTFSFPRIV